jgi:hypothetical protein
MKAFGISASVSSEAEQRMGKRKQNNWKNKNKEIQNKKKQNAAQ